MQETIESPNPHLRRLPQQTRATQRIKKIIDVSEKLFGLYGYDVVTTNAIAKDADISIGSLYHFFPNKDAILQEIISRYSHMMDQAFAPIINDYRKSVITTKEVSDQFVDTVLNIGTQNPAFALLVLQATPGSQVWESTQVLHNDIIRNIEILLKLHSPQLTAKQRNIHAITANVAVSALLARICHEIQNGNNALAKELMAQTKQMQRAYLDAVL